MPCLLDMLLNRIIGNANGILTIRGRAIQRQPTKSQRQPMSFPASRQQQTIAHPTKVVVILERLLLVSLNRTMTRATFLILEYRCSCCQDQRHSCPERYQGNGQRATRKGRWRVCQEYPYQRPQEPLHVDTRSYSSTNPT